MNPHHGYSGSDDLRFGLAKTSVRNTGANEKDYLVAFFKFVLPLLHSVRYHHHHHRRCHRRRRRPEDARISWY